MTPSVAPPSSASAGVVFHPKLILKLDLAEKGAETILLNLAIFFIPPGVGLISALDILSGNVLKIVITMVITTIITMGVTGLTVQYLINRRSK